MISCRPNRLSRGLRCMSRASCDLVDEHPDRLGMPSICQQGLWELQLAGASRRADRFVPGLDVRPVWVVVDVMERSHQLAQLQLVMECARLAGGAGDGESCGGTRGQVATIERRIVRGDRASAWVGQGVSLVPLVR